MIGESHCPPAEKPNFAAADASSEQGTLAGELHLFLVECKVWWLTPLLLAVVLGLGYCIVMKLSEPTHGPYLGCLF